MNKMEREVRDEEKKMRAEKNEYFAKNYKKALAEIIPKSERILKKADKEIEKLVEYTLKKYKGKVDNDEVSYNAWSFVHEKCVNDYFGLPNKKGKR